MEEGEGGTEFCWPKDQMKIGPLTLAPLSHGYIRTGRLWQPPVNGWRRVPLTDCPPITPHLSELRTPKSLLE